MTFHVLRERKENMSWKQQRPILADKSLSTYACLLDRTSLIDNLSEQAGMCWQKCPTECYRPPLFGSTHGMIRADNTLSLTSAHQVSFHECFLVDHTLIPLGSHFNNKLVIFWHNNSTVNMSEIITNLVENEGPMEWAGRRCGSTGHDTLILKTGPHDSVCNSMKENWRCRVGPFFQ